LLEDGMMLTLKTARAPRWSVQRRAINLLVVFEEYEHSYGEIPFSASPDDTEAYGRALFHQAQQGEFGPVDEPEETEVVAELGLRRNADMGIATQRIAALQIALDIHADAKALKQPRTRLPLSPETLRAELDSWRAYRIELAALEGQPGFPHQVEWPQAPELPALATAGL
jgi:hypothetical protein